MFNLASMVVTIKANDDALKKSVSGIKGQLSALGVAIGTAVGGIVSNAVAAAQSALSQFFRTMIGGAVELEDSLSAIGVVFGKSSEIITRNADEMAAKFGVVKGEFIGAASSLGQIFKGVGKSQDDAAKLGTSLARLGLDLASFTAGATNTQAFEALQSAFKGEFNPIERFNVILSAAAIEQEALSSGLIKNARDMDEMAKKTATFNLIMKKTVDQQGDLARTFDQTKNSWGKFTGTLVNLAVEIGKTLLPVFNAIAQRLAAFAVALDTAFESGKASIVAFGAATAVVWDSFRTGLDRIIAKVGEAKVVLTTGLLPVLGLVFGGLPGLVLGGLVALNQFPEVIASIRGAIASALSFVDRFTGGLLGVNDMAALLGAGLVVVGGLLFGLPGAIVGAVVAFTGLGGAIKEWVLDKIELVGIAWRNLPMLVEIAAILIYEKIINIGEYLATIPANARIIGNYLANNWRKLIADTLSFLGTAFANFGDNLYRLGQAIVKFLKDPSKGFDFKWKGLTDGFKATADALPALVKPSLTSFRDQVQEKYDEIARLEEERRKRLAAKPPPAAAQAAAAQAAKQAAKTSDFKSQTSSVSEFALKLRESIYEKGDNIPLRQLTAQERILAEQKKAREAFERMLSDGVMATMR